MRPLLRRPRAGASGNARADRRASRTSVADHLSAAAPRHRSVREKPATPTVIRCKAAPDASRVWPPVGANPTQEGKPRRSRGGTLRRELWPTSPRRRQRHEPRSRGPRARARTGSPSAARRRPRSRARDPRACTRRSPGGSSPGSSVITSPATSTSGALPEQRRLVDLEPDAVSERVEEPLLEHLSGRLAQLRRQSRLLVGLARQAVELPAGDARSNRVERACERIARELVVLAQLGGRPRRPRTSASCRQSTPTRDRSATGR